MNYIDNLLTDLEEELSNIEFETSTPILIQKGITNFLIENDFNPVFAEKLVSYMNIQVFISLSSEQIDKISEIYGTAIVRMDEYISKNIHPENREIFLINFTKKTSISFE